MPDIELIFKQSVYFNNLPDDFTRNAIKEFVSQRIDCKDKRSCLQRLCKSYPLNIKLDQLSFQDILKSEASWNIRNKRKLFVSFLVSCCYSGYITDSRINRLLDFQNTLDTLCANSRNICYLLKDDNYDSFKSSSLFGDIDKKYAIVVYTHTLCNKISSSDSDFVSLNTYMQDIKFRADIIPAVKRTMLLRFDEICTTLEGNASQWTAKQIIKIIENAKTFSSTKYLITIQVLHEMLSQLCNDHLIDDINIKKMVELNKVLNHNINTDQMLAILHSIHPEYWLDCSFTQPNGIKRNNIRYINCPLKDVRECISVFLSTYYVRSGSEISEFCSNFSISLGKIKIKSISELNFKTFQEQAKYFYTYGDKKNRELSILVSFYVYLSQNLNDKLFESEGVPTTILFRQSIGIDIANGYQVVQYNQLENVPESDKWLLCYKTYNRDNVVQIRAIDFTKIESKVYRSWYKHYLWKEDVTMYTKLHPFSIISYGLNYLYDLKNGTIFSIFSKPGLENVVTVGDITSYRNHVLETKSNNRTRNGYIYNIRNLLRHVDIHNLGTIEPGIFYTLTHTLDQSYDNTLPIPNEHLSSIATLLKSKAEKDKFAAICSSIFFIALETEFRASQIVNLNKDCIQPTAKHGEYVVVSETKTSANELIEQPISSYVEREIRHAITISNEYREKCTNTHLLNKLFIYPGNKKGIYRKMTEYRFNRFLRGCCKELKIPLYTLENLRDTHMTKAEEFKIRNHLSDIEQNILTGHKNTAVDDIHYVKLDIREMLEAIHGTIIGNVTLEGKILSTLDSSVANIANEVEHSCGYCNRSSCNMLINLDCILCKDFVTTVSRLPYFEEQVRLLDKRIEQTTILHDKEDLINIKRIMLRYIEEILKVKEQIE